MGPHAQCGAGAPDQGEHPAHALSTLPQDLGVFVIAGEQLGTIALSGDLRAARGQALELLADGCMAVLEPTRELTEAGRVAEQIAALAPALIGDRFDLDGACPLRQRLELLAPLALPHPLLDGAREAEHAPAAGSHATQGENEQRDQEMRHERGPRSVGPS